MPITVISVTLVMNIAIAYHQKQRSVYASLMSPYAGGQFAAGCPKTTTANADTKQCIVVWFMYAIIQHSGVAKTVSTPPGQ